MTGPQRHERSANAKPSGLASKRGSSALTISLEASFTAFASVYACSRSKPKNFARRRRLKRPNESWAMLERRSGLLEPMLARSKGRKSVFG